MEIEDFGRPAIAFDYPRRLFKDVEDVTPFDLLECAVRAFNGVSVAQGHDFLCRSSIASGQQVAAQSQDWPF